MRLITFSFHFCDPGAVLHKAANLMRFAVIDIGSDAIQLGVVEADATGDQRVLAREQARVDLGGGVLRTGLIRPEAFQSGLEALAWLAERLRSLPCGPPLTYGTAPLRSAANAGHFLEESAKLGIPIEVISCEEEARLLYLAVRHTLTLPEEPAVLISMAGCSTTLTWTTGERIPASLTLPWGPQNLAEALPTADPPSPEDLKRVRRGLRRILKQAQRQLPDDLPRPCGAWCTQGWLLDLLERGGQASALTREQALRQHRRLWRAAGQERAAASGLEPEQARIAHVASSWAMALLDWLEVECVQGLPVGLREGMLRAVLERGGATSAPPLVRRQASVERLATRLDPDPDHSHHVRRLADQLFADLGPSLGLGDLERELLGGAARLHDIGLSSGGKDHHRQGARLVQTAALEGFRPREVDVMAQLVRFHRGRAPSPDRHEDYARLSPWDRSTVEKLAAILRTADALDRGHRQAVQSVRLRLEREECQIHLQGVGDLRLELEALQEKGALLFRLLDRPVRTLVSTRR